MKCCIVIARAANDEGTALCTEQFRQKASPSLMKTHHLRSHQIQSPQEVLSLQTF